MKLTSECEALVLELLELLYCTPKMWQLINVFCSCVGLVTTFNIELLILIDTNLLPRLKD